MRRLASLLPLLLLGCAAAGPPPQATAIPYSPELVTQRRVDVADRWAADVSRRMFVEQYLNAICAPDGKWAQMNSRWTQDEADLWRNVLFHFEPIPNQPASAGGGSDIGAIIGSILGGVAKGALAITPPRATLPPGLPPC